MQTTHPNMLPHARVLAFMTAGRAIFTARGREHRFTFKVKQPKFEGVPAENLRYVYVLTGPDNTSSYQFVGSLVKKLGRWEYRHSAKSHVGPDALSVKSFGWIVKRLVADLDLTADVEIWHEGRCGCCGRPLTVPESIESGIGEKCAQKLGI